MKNYLILMVCALAGCAGPKEALVVKQYTLRDQVTDKTDDPMVRQEKLRRLYGAVSMEERGNRLGQYFTVLWNAEAGAKKELLFQYLQGESGSRVKTMRRDISGSGARGKEEFSVIGKDYFENGRVLAWKMSLIVDGEPISTKQSYLWE
ncbi:hypothetical protein ACFSSA_04570 [Luteolibacter algae]|uniref:Lipoprotein n=1 Tax=Luteolibacter algae TaxID=454151 RepID=A0ABW5D4J2_9BACT